MSKKITAILIAVVIISLNISYFEFPGILSPVYAEDTPEDTPQVVVLTGDPEEILTNPKYDLTANVDPVVLSEWYASEVMIVDATLRLALLKAARTSTLTVADMFSLPSTLDLTGLGIYSLKGMEYAINVKKLVVSKNNLTTLEPLKDLYNLEYLDYSGNAVKLVPSWAFTSRKLYYVNGNANSSAAISAPLGPYSKLQSLYLDDNEISSVPDISFCSDLTMLSLANNSLEAFPQSIAALSGLRDLNLSGNKIKSMTDLSMMGTLTNLNLENNEITEFPAGMEGLVSLVYLSMNNNSISIIPAEVSNMTSLETLILYQNKIENLSDGLLSLPALKMLDVSLNNLNAENNAELITSLEANVSSFYYRLQLPRFDLELFEDKEAPAGRLVWSGIEDTSIEGEGGYTVTKFTIERIEEKLPDENDLNNTPDSLSSTSSVPKVNVYTIVGEVDGLAREFVDLTAQSGVDYTFKVTAYILVNYQNGNTVEITDVRTINTKYMQARSDIKELLTYIGVILGLCLLLVAMIMVINKFKMSGRKRVITHKAPEEAKPDEAENTQKTKGKTSSRNEAKASGASVNPAHRTNKKHAELRDKTVKKRDVISAWDDVNKLDSEIDKLLSEETDEGGKDNG